MDDPSNDAALSEVSQYCGLEVKPMLAARSDIRAAIRVYYHGVEDAPAEAAAVPPAPPSPKPASKPKPAAVAAPRPATLPPEELVPESEPAAAQKTKDSPDAAPEIEAKEISIPKPKKGPAVPMVALTLLDGTTIQLPARRRTPSSPDLEVKGNELTARDLVMALRAMAQGTDAAQVLGQAPKWESIVASLLSVLLRKGLVADWEFLEEYRKI